MKVVIVLALTGLAAAQTTDWNSRGRRNFEAGNLRAAKYAFERSVERSAGDPQYQAIALTNLAQTLVALGEWSRAKPVLEQARKLSPQSPQVWHLIGQALYHTGGTLAAEEAIRNAIALAEGNPEIVSACLSDLVTLFPESDLRISLEALRDAVNSAPPGQARGRMLANLGILQWQAGQGPAADTLSRALEEMENAVGPSHPDLAFILENYAAVLRKKGQKAKAKEAVGRARALRSAFASQANTDGSTIDWNDLRRRTNRDPQ